MNKEMLEKVLKDIKSPYFKNMEKLGLNNKEKKSLLSKVFNQPISIENQSIYDTNDNLIYREMVGDLWYKKKYDKNRNQTYFENNDGFWVKKGYDKNNNQIYHETSDGEITEWRNNKIKQ